MATRGAGARHHDHGQVYEHDLEGHQDQSRRHARPRGLWWRGGARHGYDRRRAVARRRRGGPDGAGPPPSMPASLHAQPSGSASAVYARAFSQRKCMLCRWTWHAVVSRPLLAHCFSLCDLRLFVIRRILPFSQRMSSLPRRPSSCCPRPSSAGCARSLSSTRWTKSRRASTRSASSLPPLVLPCSPRTPLPRTKRP